MRRYSTSAGGPKTMYDKIWNAHVVHQRSPTSALIFVDRHLVHEVTSPQAFEGLRNNGRKVRRPDCTMAVADHNVTTSRERLLPGGKIGDDPESLLQLAALERNVKEFGVPYIALRDKRQGIVHVVGPEQGLTQPGMVIVCGDSHTASHGAVGALAFGIGTSEVEHVLATQTLAQSRSKNMRVTVEGKLAPWISGKDVILHVISKIGTAGGNGCVIEFDGSAIRSLSMEGRLTVTNMTIEAGARAGLVAPDQVTIDYLKNRPYSPTPGPMWEQAVENWMKLPSDKGAKFDIEVSFRAEDIAPCVSWGTNPEQSLPVTALVPDPKDEKDVHKRAAHVRALEYMGLKAGEKLSDVKIDAVFIGSCTNGRIEDIRAATEIAKGRKVLPSVRAMVVPGSGLVKEQAEKEGLLQILRDSGFDVREPGCSMCLGMNGDQLKPQERCASTSNRNFEGRQGRGGRTHLLSPAMAAAAAITGKLTDVRTLVGHRGLHTSSSARNSARKGVTVGRVPWSGAVEAFVCHTGQAVPMLKPNIDTDEIIPARFLKTIQKKGLGFGAFEKSRYLDKDCKELNPAFLMNTPKFAQASIIVAAENFGCGSSREHAPWAMLDMGVRVVIAPSFADIFYNNSFKNGLLPIAITNPKDFEALSEDAKAGKQLTVDLEKNLIQRPDGTSVAFSVDAGRRAELMEGLDEIGVTLKTAESSIQKFEAKRRQELPWLYQ